MREEVVEEHPSLAGFELTTCGTENPHAKHLPKRRTSDALVMSV